MLDPRIYRRALVPVVLAVIVFAFSLEDQQGALSTNVVPDAFNGAHAYAAMTKLARLYPDRRPGSAGDQNLASNLAGTLRGYGFQVSSDVYSAPTVAGARQLENVVGVRAGGGPGSLVIVSHRDAPGSPSVAGLSGTAVMLELARVLSGQTQNRTLVVASTSGSDGASGARRLASVLPGPIDAVLVLGDLAKAGSGQPAIVPWSEGQLLAPTGLRRTVAGAVRAQTGRNVAQAGLGPQLAHLAFPLSSTEQAPFNSSGDPAVLLSLSGAADPSPSERFSQQRITALGRAVLQSISALQAGGAMSAPSSYLLWQDKVLPAWAVRLLTLVLILPVLIATVDGLARARRRGHSVSRWVGWVLAAALPFLLACLLVMIAEVTGWIGPSPAAPVTGAPLGPGGIALLVLMAALIAGGLLWLRPWLLRALDLDGRLTMSLAPGRSPGPVVGRARDEAAAPAAGAAVALLTVLCAVALVMWLANPFTALLLIPALHLWLWVVAPDVRLPVPARVLLLLTGLAPLGLVAAYFAGTFGLGPVGFAWTGVLMLAGGAVGWLSAIEWSLVAGCLISAAALAWRSAQAARIQPVPVTIRGPVSYAGPGSLGGTESALRR